MIDVGAFHYKRKFSKCIFLTSRILGVMYILFIVPQTIVYVGTYFELTAYNLSC